MVAIKREFLSRNGGNKLLQRDTEGRGESSSQRVILKALSFAVVIDFAFLLSPLSTMPQHRVSRKSPFNWIRTGFGSEMLERSTNGTSVPLSKRGKNFCRSGFTRALHKNAKEWSRALIPGNKRKPKVRTQGEERVSKLRERIKRRWKRVGFFSYSSYDDENNYHDEEFKEESRRNAKYGIPGGRRRRRRRLVRVNSFRDHSRISLHSPEYSRRLDCHASFSTFPRLAISLLRGGWTPWRGGWLCIE